MQPLPCTYCNTENTTTVNSYKHYWITCKDCGNMYRKRKERYAFDNGFFRFIFNKFPSLKFYLFPVKEIISNESVFYDSYSKDVTSRTAKGTKWEGMYEMVNSNLKEYEFDLAGKSVLDISGGPGFFAKDVLLNGAKRVVVTEYSKISADAMADYLGIESVKYDYNTDELDSCIDGKFDVIFLIYSIGFCNNLDKLVKSINSISNPGAIVYITYSPPTLGLSMRWQFDEYTYNKSWLPETITKHFSKLAFIEIIQEIEGSFSYKHNNDYPEKDFFWRPGFKNALASFILKNTRDYYIRKALKNKYINKELVQKNIRHIFKLSN
ncbi:MAG: hypothetical protein JWN83_1663 [Chitinophagaceae bacterium]|nr:hypothetical protein [Chitinophagaceae bacterium]